MAEHTSTLEIPLKTGFLPASTLSEDGPVKWDYELPNFGDYQLSLNASRLASIVHWAGMGAIAIEQRVLRSSPYPVAEEGEALEQKEKSAQVTALLFGGQAGQLQSDVLRVGEVKHYLWPDCTIQINPPSTNPDLNDKKQAQAWAKHFDKSIKVGLYAAAKEHLVLDTSEVARWLLAMQIGNISAIPIRGISSLSSVAIILTLNQVFNMGEAVLLDKTQGLPISDRRFSLFYSAQFDRLAVVRFMLAGRRLVKSTPVDQNDNSPDIV